MTPGPCRLSVPWCARPGWLLVGLLLLLPARLAGQPPSVVGVDAWPGEPFGVGKVSFRTGQEGKMIQSTGGLLITEADDRLFYPAFTDGLLSKVLDPNAVGGMHSVWFLFRGDQPLNITLTGAEPVTFTVVPESRRPLRERRAWQAWWRNFRGRADQQARDGDYPPLVEAYLVAMLQHRMDLPDSITRQFQDRTDDQLQETVKLMFDVESLRAESIRQLMLAAPTPDNQASLPLPPPVSWASPRAPPTGDVEIEPIARYVPRECYYLRFGNWNNQVWLKRLISEFGGDLTRMISRRGHRGGDTQKMLDQMVIESSQVDDWFGGNLIDDVAAIGTDLYIDDGPSSAILMMARGRALENQMRSRRKAYARSHADQGVTLTEMEINGHPVTLLSTPDNRIRSFYAVDDLCHITSTSRTIVERFFEAGQGIDSLADSPDFRLAREALPLDRDYTVFVYLSRDFFENLLSPRYQVELARRNLSLANIQLLQLAQWAAAHEGYPDDDLDLMIRLGFLPEDFSQLPDGSTGDWRDGGWHDSIRGLRGYYLPIADAEVTAITPAENAVLRQRLAWYQDRLQGLDPMLVAFKRFNLGNNVERVVIDGRVAPFGKEKYGWLGNLLGPPLQVEIGGPPDELVSLQASMAGNVFSRSQEPHQVFASVLTNIPPKTNLQPTNLFELLQLLKNTPGYLGAWPKPGYLDILPELGAAPDAEGFTYSPILDLWRLQFGDFSMLAFDRILLQAARPFVQVEPAERPAQVRLRVGDVANSNMRGWANVLYFEHGWATSIANVKLLNMMIQQMGLPAASALTQAEQLLGVQLACPLGGQYVFAETPEGRLAWQSTAWPSFADPRVPSGYLAPPIAWFRGMKLDVYQRESQFVIHGILDIARGQIPTDPVDDEKGFWDQLPDFSMFRGFSPVEEIPAGEELPDNQDELKAPGDDGR